MVVVLGGLVLFALALAWASTELPEWQIDEMPTRERIERRAAESAARMGLEIEEVGPIHPVLGAMSEMVTHSPYQSLGGRTNEVLRNEHRQVLLTLRAEAEHPQAGPVSLTASLDLAGRPWQATVTHRVDSGMFQLRPGLELPDPTPMVLAPGESLDRRAGVYEERDTLGMMQLEAVAVAGAEPPQTVLQMVALSPVRTAVREIGTLDGLRQQERRDYVLFFLSMVMVTIVVCSAAAVVVFAMAVRRRLDLANAVVVAGLSAVALVVLLLGEPWQYLLFSFIGPLFALGVALVFLLWAAGESWLRDQAGDGTGDLTLELDALRNGRVGRRVGRAAAWGLGLGAAAAGAELAWRSLVTGAGWSNPVPQTLLLTPLPPGVWPLLQGASAAALVLFAWALAARLRPAFLRLPVVALVLGTLWVLVLPGYGPWLPNLVPPVAIYGLLALALLRGGTLGLLVGSLTAQVLPLAAFALQMPSWLGAEIAASTAVLAAFGLVAVVGTRRSPAYREEVDAPEFVRRQREERRLSYEMEILSRMQVGLLPAEPPRVAGWDIAASSMLAHEVGGDFYDFVFDSAGRLWIAAGDVAGHGSFCSIGHAMTKAALASLIDEGEETTPSAVLLEVDRVLRTVDNRRMFTALALLRLEPATGRALVANGGYPYPLLRLLPETTGEEAESPRVVELELPGLPLGEGPPRRYEDLEITVPPGGVLVLSSDGLFEALGRGERPYGFDRPRQVVARSTGESAEGVLSELVDDWRRFVGTAPLADDTTLVVIRRAPAAADGEVGR